MAAPLDLVLERHALLRAGGVQDGADAIWLIAPDTRRFWDHLSTQPEARDGKPDRVDRWSHRVLGEIAAETGTVALLPFGGPPWHPFIDWAQRSGTAWPSPVGPLVHARMGLWLSFRGALREPGAKMDQPAASRPCDTCAKPCLTACPVGAMGHGPYDVAACRAHVASDEGIACRSGCLVRRACPVGPEFALPPAQARHHMQAFLGHRP